VLPKWDDYVRHGSAMVCAASGRLVFPTPRRQSRLYRQHLENPTVFIIALLARSSVTATTRAYRRYVGSCIVAFIFLAYRYSIEMEGATRERQRLCFPDLTLKASVRLFVRYSEWQYSLLNHYPAIVYPNFQSLARDKRNHAVSHPFLMRHINSFSCFDRKYCIRSMSHGCQQGR